MAEELIAGVCSSSSSSSSSWWWCTAMSGSIDWAAAAVDMFDLPRCSTRCLQPWRPVVGANRCCGSLEEPRAASMNCSKGT
ncbi:hypothetical protein OPV22_004896 [Ensete ventricosum]|uniref:Secreted protein n=1 Tax=Ensete ventricosum TaxID=4639 RepID=A0AAV8RBM4_ENSVE|nr:hypothetical protein OPV22_004896 [Ensete ventricosum]